METSQNNRLDTLKEQAHLTKAYRFFDTPFFIKSNSEKSLGFFRDIFSRFLVNDTNQAGPSYYVLENDIASDQSAVIVGDRLYTIEDPGDLAGYAYMKITDAVLSNVRSHYLIHAACLSFKNRGIIFPAASRSGKTTLTLELVKRGFEFLSDDIAGISLSDNLLYPFVKALGMLQPTLEICPEANLESLRFLPMIGGGEKRLLDIETLYPDCIGKPCKLKYIVFLEPEPSETESNTKDDTPIYIVLNKITDDFISDLKNVEGISDVVMHPYKKYPILKLSLNNQGIGNFLLEDICYKHDILLYDNSSGREKKIDFNETPQLKTISKSKAARKLLKELKGGSKSAILHDVCGNNVSELFMNMVKLLEDVTCFYLTPGRLKERANKIYSLLND